MNTQEISKLLDYSVELLNKLNITGVQNAMILSAAFNALNEAHKKLDEAAKSAET